jgi:hypothetical protein
MGNPLLSLQALGTQAQNGRYAMSQCAECDVLTANADLSPHVFKPYGYYYCPECWAVVDADYEAFKLEMRRA